MEEEVVAKEKGIVKGCYTLLETCSVGKTVGYCFVGGLACFVDIVERGVDGEVR